MAGCGAGGRGGRLSSGSGKGRRWSSLLPLSVLVLVLLCGWAVGGGGAGGRDGGATAFRFLSVIATSRPVQKEQRGWHFVLAVGGGGNASAGPVVYACGILGELAAIDFGVPERPQRLWLLQNFSQIPQARTLTRTPATIPGPGPGLGVAMGFADLAFVPLPTAKGAAAPPRLHSRISLPLGNRTGDNGVNGLVALTDSRGRAYLLGSAMPGGVYLVNITAPAGPILTGTLYTEPFATFDICVFQHGAEHYAAVVNAHPTSARNDVLRIYRVSVSGGVVVPPALWVLESTVYAGRGGHFTGCNRVRYHRAFLFFSCFGNAVVGFVDVSDPASPRLQQVVPYVTEQPTGMLVVGDALLVAGGRELMAFNVSAPSGGCPTVAVCSAECHKGLASSGQNMHSLAHVRQAGGAHLLFLTGQIDNVVACVEAVAPPLVALLEA